jgi:hypothetical protein
MHTRNWTRNALWAISLLALSATGARAADDAVPPGQTWVLDSNNWQQAEGLLPPPVLERVKKGDYWYKVRSVDPDKFKQNYSTTFWAASEANEGKYDVDAETCGLKDVKTGKEPEFYFGYPFPKIDPKDPFAGCKMAWNFTSATAQGGGGGATFTLNGIDTNGEYKRIKAWIHSMAFLGRHGGPIPNPENLQGTGLSGVLEPSDIDGVGGLVKRTNSWTSQDKVWFYVPATRRVRQASAASRSEPVAGMDIFADDLNCYGGKVEYYKWKVVGEGNILAPVLQPEPLVPQPISDSRTESRFRLPQRLRNPRSERGAVVDRRQPGADSASGVDRGRRVERSVLQPARSSCTSTRTCTGSIGSWYTSGPESTSTTRCAPITGPRAPMENGRPSHRTSWSG